MKRLIIALLLVLSILMIGCAKEPIVGNDRDEHGCIGSAGYSWCEAKQKCLRTWEENCSENQQETVVCGGWDTYGEVTCECTGTLTKVPCPSDAVCDSGQYSCEGKCGECKCFQGPATNGNAEPCNGRNNSYTEHVCTEEESLADICTMDYSPVCGKIVLNTGETLYQTYSNGCSACAAMKVVSYTPGECPPDKTAELCSDTKGNYMTLTDAEDIAKASECGDNLIIDCACPTGYRKEGDSCNPDCYYSTPRCLAPSTQCEKTYFCNEGTGSFWINLDLTQKGCSPACVINLETANAEINWRCTGLIENPDNNLPYDPNYSIEIDPADQACQTDDDCVMTMVQCSCDCGAPINKIHKQEYLDERDRMCESYTGIMCGMRCEYELKCINNICTAVSK